MQIFQRASRIAALLCVAAACTQAFGAYIEGGGQMDSTLNPDTTQFQEVKSILNELSMFRETQTALPGSLSAYQRYDGYATYGRISTRAQVSTQQSLGHPPPGVYSGLFLGSWDEITVSGAGPLGFLQLEISLSGYAQRQSSTFGNYAVAIFSVATSDLAESEESYQRVFEVQFWWTDEGSIQTSSDIGDWVFAAHPGEELAFSPLGPLGEHSFGGRGYVNIPLYLLDPAFRLELTASSAASCSETSTADCVSHSNFGSTALIGNARIVDAAGDVIPGASFTSASGYDYITPPGAPGGPDGGGAVPEPASVGLTAAGLAMIAVAARAQRTRAATARK